MTATIVYFVPMEKLPNRVRAMRKQAGMTLVEVGEALGLTHTHISNIERGVRKLDLDTMEKLARVLRCSVADFLTEDHFPYRNSPLQQVVVDNMAQMDERDQQRIADITTTFVPEPRRDGTND